MDNHVSPYKWNNHSSIRKQMWKDEYLESKSFEEWIKITSKHSKINSQELKCFFWHFSTLFTLLRLVVSTQTKHTCHITQLNWEIIFFRIKFFSSLSPCQFFICGGEWHKPITHCTVQLYFWCTKLRSGARRVMGPDHWVRFWGDRFTTSSGSEVAGLPHHHLSAGLHSNVDAQYWTDGTCQNSCVISLELWTRNTYIWAL